uniref:Uncharacterized protein n=1 Tax=Utricularia reniformis TaxID=192314 RepID=A0A1Y0B3R3_9LAMI|nr:hypothetical protein AEK19_MT0839 [Utricularia reniformis]YP_009382298.1 hypothetical protein AEK19_MT1870 [Utricularia reniformis]ART31071.1 hypothetical protein AEK19_MT0839 [Utricularia reniformis]ART32040.1 hypothetical protein AEK19_MT1870 [Utricularia reniformis]
MGERPATDKRINPSSSHVNDKILSLVVYAIPRRVVKEKISQ